MIRILKSVHKVLAQGSFEVSFAKSPKYSLDLMGLGCKTHNVHPGKLGGVIILG
jgi:hypothetical protein